MALPKERISLKKLQKCIAYLFLSLFLVSCSANDYTENNLDAGMEEITMDREMDTDVKKENSSDSQLIGEKVIKTVDLQYETIYYDEMMKHVMETVKKYKAYIEYSYESTYSEGGYTPDSQIHEYRNMSYTLRVPTKDLSVFLKDMEGAQAVKISEQMGSQDVTQMYRDTETRMNVLKRKEDRLNELMEQADTVDQIIQIENSLSDTISEREQLQSQLDNFDELIDFTVVNMNIEERQRISSRNGDSISFWERIKEALLDSIFVFYYWIQNAFIWFIYALPFLVIIGIFIAVFVYIRRKKPRKQKMK